MQNDIQNFTPRASIPALWNSRLFPLCVLLFAACILMLPIWLFGLPTNAHDTRAHASWQHYFSNQFWNGDIYPRWLAGMNEGLGSPSFFLYPPLSQYVPALLAPFSDSATWIYQRIGISATAAFFLSGIGAHLWLNKVTQDRISSLVGAIVFLAAPYHLFIDTYYRAAYAELWAFAWAPFSLLAIHLFRDKVKMALVMYTVSTAALIFSHAPSCIALLPVYFAYAALLSIIYKHKGIFLWTCVATATAMLIAGIYLGSALTHQENINTAALFSGYFDFPRWFMFSAQRWPDKGMEMTTTGAALVQFCIVLLLGCIVMKRDALNRRRKLLAGFAVAMSVILFFMMSGMSAPIWKGLPVIHKIQFPWRLLIAQTLLLAMSAALFLASIRSDSRITLKSSWHFLMPLLIATLLVINLALILYSKPSFTTSKPLGVRDTPEYHLGSIDKSNGLFHETDKVRLLDGHGHVSVEAISPREMRIHVNATTPVSFIVRQFYYPGWECFVSAGQTPCSVAKYDKNVPIITMNTGAGEQFLTLRLTPSAYDQMGFMATLAGIWILVGLCVFLPRPTRTVQIRDTSTHAINPSISGEAQSV